MMSHQTITFSFNPFKFFTRLMGLLLLWAALSKLGDPVAFLNSLLAYKLPFPMVLLKVAAMTLPWLELLCGFLLFTDKHRSTSLSMVVTLFSVFLAVTGMAWIRGLDISCGCFNLSLLGIDNDNPAIHLFESVQFAFFRNLLLAGTAFALFRNSLKHES